VNDPNNPILLDKESINEPSRQVVAVRSKDVTRRKRAQHNLIGIAIFLVLAGSGYWYFRNYFSLPLKDIASFEQSVEGNVVSEVSQTISIPPPLKATKKALVSSKGNSALTNGGIVAQTNIALADNGSLPALLENATLDDIAALRLDDMFAKQYFEHVAPDGGSATTVATAVGYSYLELGENLALGGFTGDADVVTAWMNSPGHRANILNTRYTEIGVAARKGTFEGVSQWIAVQIFGRPSSDCPSPETNLKASIDASESQLTQMNADLEQSKAEIDAMQPQYGEAYNAKVQAYNDKVAQYNALAAQVKAAIATYNGEVQAFNQCLAA